MRLSHILRRGVLCTWIALQCVWQLTGCGGSLVAGGVGSGGSGVAEGSVTGFGSVIVDGVAYADGSATVERWGESGVAEVKLGQRVRVVHDASGQATRIVVLPQLIGIADHAPDQAGEFVLLGQRVRVVNTGNADYPATVFDGLTQVGAGDALEVHGSWSRGSDGVQVLIASRIEKLASSPDTLLVTALVSARLANVLTLDDAIHTTITAADIADTVQTGTLVSLWLASSAVQGAQPWVATRAELASASVDSGSSLDMRAVVSDVDSQQRRIRVQGLWVKLPNDWNGAPPTEGAAVQLKLQRNGNDWQASSVSMQRTEAQPDVELKGSLRWNANTGSVLLRGTTVQLSNSLLVGSCGGLQNGEEVYIKLKAQRSNPGLPPQASELECSRQIPDTSVQDAEGTLLSVDAAAKTVAVRVNTSTLTLTWVNAQTLMPSNLQGLINRSVEIEYQRSSTGLMLRKLKPE